MLGEEEPARIALKKAVDANADFPGKDDARKRLAVLAIRSERRTLPGGPNWKTT